MDSIIHSNEEIYNNIRAPSYQHYAINDLKIREPKESSLIPSIKISRFDKKKESLLQGIDRKKLIN